MKKVDKQIKETFKKLALNDSGIVLLVRNSTYGYGILRVVPPIIQYFSFNKERQPGFKTHAIFFSAQWDHIDYHRYRCEEQPYFNLTFAPLAKRVPFDELSTTLLFTKQSLESWMLEWYTESKNMCTDEESFVQMINDKSFCAFSQEVILVDWQRYKSGDTTPNDQFHRERFQKKLETDPVWRKLLKKD